MERVDGYFRELRATLQSPASIASHNKQTLLPDGYAMHQILCLCLTSFFSSKAKSGLDLIYFSNCIDLLLRFRMIFGVLIPRR